MGSRFAAMSGDFASGGLRAIPLRIPFAPSAKIS